jgi:hypothetical protein
MFGIGSWLVSAGLKAIPEQQSQQFNFTFFNESGEVKEGSMLFKLTEISTKIQKSETQRLLDDK